jgi:hypothetical protein
LVQVDTKYDDAKKKADTQGQADFKKELDATKLKVTALDTPDKNTVAGPEIAAIKAKLAKAEGYAGTNQFPDALQLLTEIKNDCESAEKLVAQQLALNKAATEAGDATNNIDKHPKTAVKAVQKLHDQLKTHPQEPVIRFELGEIQKKIDKAKAAVV